MRRLLGVLPLALLSAGCGLRPWTPSVSVAFWAEDVPGGREVGIPTSSDVARAWTLPADSPWAPYGKGTLFSAADALGTTATLPAVADLEVAGAAQRAAAHVAEVGLPSGTMWMLDLRGAASCAFAATLTRAAREPVAPVVTFNNWPADEELVPADETFAGVLAFSPKLPAPGAAPSTPVFLLDSWRLAYRYDDPGPDTYDNRYALTESDFPSAAALRAQGVARVVYVVEDLDDAEVEEDDLHATFMAYQAAGIAIYMVDLAFLKDVAPPRGGMYPADWTAQLAPQAYVVRSRYTLMDDHVFYARARAGFGSARGRPVIGAGGGFHGGGGG